MKITQNYQFSILSENCAKHIRFFWCVDTIVLGHILRFSNSVCKKVTWSLVLNRILNISPIFPFSSFLEQRVSRVHHLSSNIGKVPKRPTCDSKEPFYLEQPPRPPRPPKAKYSTMFLFMTISLHSHHTALMTMLGSTNNPIHVHGEWEE